jgi:Flp pilus assembly protein TadG
MPPTPILTQPSSLTANKELPVIRIPGRKVRRGAAAVEMALVLPLMLWLLVGVWEVGRMVEVQQLLSNAAREGARQAATGQFTNAQVEQVVVNYLKVAGIPTTNLNTTGNTGIQTITGTPQVQMVTDVTNPSYDVSQAAYLDQIKVTVQIPFQDVKWSLLNLITNSSTTMNATVIWYTMVDKPYPTPPEPPPG